MNLATSTPCPRDQNTCSGGMDDKDCMLPETCLPSGEQCPCPFKENDK